MSPPFPSLPPSPPPYYLPPTDTETKAFADRIGAGFAETSAVSGENVSKALWLMVASVVESVGGGKGKKKRRRGLKMPWNDTARLR